MKMLIVGIAFYGLFTIAQAQTPKLPPGSKIDGHLVILPNGVKIPIKGLHLDRITSGSAGKSEPSAFKEKMPPVLEGARIEGKIIILKDGLRIAATPEISKWIKDRAPGKISEDEKTKEKIGKLKNDCRWNTAYKNSVPLSNSFGSDDYARSLENRRVARKAIRDEKTAEEYQAFLQSLADDEELSHWSFFESHTLINIDGEDHSLDSSMAIRIDSP
jgi:hypothetical protein